MERAHGGCGGCPIHRYEHGRMEERAQAIGRFATTSRSTTSLFLTHFTVQREVKHEFANV